MASESKIFCVVVFIDFFEAFDTVGCLDKKELVHSSTDGHQRVPLEYEFQLIVRISSAVPGQKPSQWDSPFLKLQTNIPVCLYTAMAPKVHVHIQLHVSPTTFRAIRYTVFRLSQQAPALRSERTSMRPPSLSIICER